MRKVKLDVDELVVESFELAAGQDGKGTVRGRAADAEGTDYAYQTPDTCLVGYCTVATPTCMDDPTCMNNYTCVESTCWTSCAATCRC